MAQEACSKEVVEEALRGLARDLEAIAKVIGTSTPENARVLLKSLVAKLQSDRPAPAPAKKPIADGIGMLVEAWTERHQVAPDSLFITASVLRALEIEDPLGFTAIYGPAQSYHGMDVIIVEPTADGGMVAVGSLLEFAL